MSFKVPEVSQRTVLEEKMFVSEEKVSIAISKRVEAPSPEGILQMIATVRNITLFISIQLSENNCLY